LWVYNDNDNNTTQPFIHNKINDKIIFKTTASGNVTHTPLVLSGPDVLPGNHLASNIGSPTVKFHTIYASTFNGVATQAGLVTVAGTGKPASETATAGTIVARTSNDETINGLPVSAGSIRANYFVGIATTALFADLAEKYLADDDYSVGTVMMVGGELEVTNAQPDSRPLGVISENPAYMMNCELEGGVYVALKGRVPVKVVGIVKKGDRLIAAEDGTAKAVSANHLGVFAIALESSDDEAMKLIEAVIL
jgi:hypothetical protein